MAPLITKVLQSDLAASGYFRHYQPGECGA